MAALEVIVAVPSEVDGQTKHWFKRGDTDVEQRPINTERLKAEPERACDDAFRHSCGHQGSREVSTYGGRAGSGDHGGGWRLPGGDGDHGREQRLS